jgi:DinB family protein
VGDASVSKLRVRVAEAASWLSGLDLPALDALGSPDPETGERWSVRNVMGHLSEALPFWANQVRQVLAGATETGRGDADYVRRREGVEAHSSETGERLRARVSGAIGEVSSVLATLSDADLRREVLHRARSAEHPTQLGDLIERMLVGHLEEHVKQIAAISE